MKNKTRDIICSLLFLVLGIFMFSQSLKITSIMGKDLGSGFMPKVIAVALVLTSLLKLIVTFFEKNSSSEEEKENKDQDSKGGLLTIGALLFYVLTFEILGFIISTTAYLFIQMLVFSDDTNRKPLLFLIISVVFSIATYVLFVYLIQRPLPTGILSFL